MKRIISLIAMLALTLGVLAGCGNSASVSQSGGADAGLREINIVLDWYPNAVHSFIYTAIEKGYYADEGLKVNVQFPSNSNDALSLVSAGRAEIGVYYQHDVIQTVADQGVGLKAIGTIVQSPLNVLLSLKDKNITSPADLVGKTVGYSGTAFSEAHIKTMMESVGASYSDVKMVDVGFELMSAMTTGNVDATIGCYVNHEVPELESEGFDLNYFMVEGYGIPDYYELVFITSNKLAEADSEMLSGFLRASKKGFEDFKNDPASSLAILMKNQNEDNFPLTKEVEEKSCDVLLPLMETSGAEFLSQDDKVWQESIDWMYKAGLISNKIDVSDVMLNLDY